MRKALTAVFRALGGAVRWASWSHDSVRVPFEGGYLEHGTGVDVWVFDDGSRVTQATAVGPCADNARIVLSNGRVLEVTGAGPAFQPTAPFRRRAIPWRDLAQFVAEGGSLPSYSEKRVVLASGCTLLARVAGGGWQLEVYAPGEAPPHTGAAQDGPQFGFLVYIDEFGLQRSRTLLPGERVSVGRDRSAGICVQDRTVSRMHAHIGWDAGPWVEDAGSTSGTFVGSRRITGRHELLDGDEIVCGGLTLRFAIRPQGGQEN